MQRSLSFPVQRGPSPYPLSRFSERPSPYYSPQVSSSTYRHRDGAERNDQIAKALGWFSIGIGIVQLLAPRATSRAAGLANHDALVRAVGVREIASGVGILSQSRPTGWLWTRVAGDAMDLAMLGLAGKSSDAARRRVAVATAAIAGITALDVMFSMRQRQRIQPGMEATSLNEINVNKSIAINLPADECYQFWRNFQNFPRFMQHLENVQIISDKRSHWKAKSPAGTTVEWDADITIDEPGKMLAWSSVGDADVENSGVVRFETAPGGRGTIVRVELQYRPPGGIAGATIAKLFGEEPSQQIDDDLRHFKQLIETGEIPTTEGQPSGRRSPLARLLRKGAPG